MQKLTVSNGGGELCCCAKFNEIGQRTTELLQISCYFQLSPIMRPLHKGFFRVGELISTRFGIKIGSAVSC